MELIPECSNSTFRDIQSRHNNQRVELLKETILKFDNTTHFKNTHPYIGVALIFNYFNIKYDPQNCFTRKGTECDAERIERIFQLYGFDVRHYQNLTKENTIKVLENVANEDHSNNDCLVVVIMSHLENNIVRAFDETMHIENFWNPFFEVNCKSLTNKPKIFLIQGCAGINIKFDSSPSSSSSSSSSLSSYNPILNKPLKRAGTFSTFKTPDAIDFFLFYSTFEGYILFENKKQGSWFIQTICEVLEECYENNDEINLNHFGTIVNSRIAQEFYSKSKEIDLKEMPNIFSTLTKSFVLNKK